MEIPDLHIFPQDHPPSPWDSRLAFLVERDQWVVATLPDGLTLCAIGWLGSRVPSRGSVPAEVIDRLLLALESGGVISDSMKGVHTCEICIAIANDPERREYPSTDRWRDKDVPVWGACHLLLKRGAIVYMCPTMITHYILRHAYMPPAAFMQAVIEGSFLTMEDLETSPPMSLTELSLLKGHRT